MQITQKQFCGHWADADLARALALKIRQADECRRELRDLEEEMLFIQSEQRERGEAQHGPEERPDWSQIQRS